jgi:hypothetical protein
MLPSTTALFIVHQDSISSSLKILNVDGRYVVDHDNGTNAEEGKMCPRQNAEPYVYGR